jgi:hypothetical protein
MGMKNHSKLFQSVALLLAVLLLTNGCTMTRELWTDRLFHPHARPRLQLDAAPERPLLLVQYREQFEKTKHIKSRAFWLDLEAEYVPHVRPKFVNPADYPGLLPVPVFDVTRGTNSLPPRGYAAVETPGKPGFDLWRDGQPLGRFQLPAYEGDAPVTTETVAKTPLTLLADGVVIVVVTAVVVVLVVGYLHAESND